MKRVLRGDHCRCSACGLEFNSTGAFDFHRRGDSAAGNRRCLTVAEMLSAKMEQNSGGWWVRTLRANAVSNLHAGCRSGDLAQLGGAA